MPLEIERFRKRNTLQPEDEGEKVFEPEPNIILGLQCHSTPQLLDGESEEIDLLTILVRKLPTESLKDGLSITMSDLLSDKHPS